MIISLVKLSVKLVTINCHQEKDQHKVFMRCSVLLRRTVVVLLIKNYMQLFFFIGSKL